MSRLKSKYGFTLAELLVVIAIIAVLVAVAIPVFSASLDKANLAADAATERQAIAAASVTYLANKGWLDTLIKNEKWDTENKNEDYKYFLYFYYNPTSGELDNAKDTDPNDSKWNAYKVGKWRDHKDKYLMVLIKPDGTVLLRWGGEGTSGGVYGFVPAPSIEELQKTRS